MVNVADLAVAQTTAPPPIQRIEQQAMGWPDRAAEVEIKDQASYDVAVELLKGIKGLRDEAETHHRPVIDAAHKAHKAACAALNRVDEPLESAQKTIKAKVSKWYQDQERLRLEAELAAKAEAKRIADEQLERELEALEAAGAQKEEVAAVIEQAQFQPIVAPRPVATFQQSKSVPTTEIWTAEVTSMIQFVKWIAENPSFIGLLQVNQTALNNQARSLKASMAFPGVKANKAVNVSVRR